MLKNNKKEKHKTIGTLRERERERESSNLKRENSSRLKVLKLNLSATMVVAGVIVFVILAIIAVRMIVTAINSRSQRAMAEEETTGYTMVDSTELGEDGKPLQVPVPDGFTASQVPGETTVNGGFVIYEGEVDWSKIEDLDSYAEVEDTAEEVETQAEDSSTENSNSDASNSENNENSEEVSTESNSLDATSNSDSTTTNENNIEEVGEEQTQDANSEQVDLPQNLQEDVQENVISEENEVIQEQIDAEKEQEEMINTEQTENIEENPEELDQGNNEIINEEEITDEEAGVATTAEEGNEEIETMSEEDEGIAPLAEGETPTTVFELQTSVNQYVWVPVKDISRIYGVDSNGKLWGKLYNYLSTGRTNNNWSENSTSGVMSITNKTESYREPDVVYYGTYFDGDSKLQGYRDGIEQYQMLSQEMEESFYKMIESVKKYGGFYIGRYETGNLSQTEAVVKKMNTDIVSQ